MSSRRAVITQIADALVAAALTHPLRVAIDGITAVGKTTFAQELTAAVRERGRPCLHVSMDGFHHSRAVRYRQGRESATGYYEDAYDFGALRAVLLDPLGPTGNGTYQTSVLDLARDEATDEPTRTAEPDLVLIVDGSFLQRPELNGAWDVVVFLRSSFEAAITRGAARDAAQLGSLAEARRIFEVRYHAAHHRYLDTVDPESRADIVIDHEDPAHPVLVRGGVQPM